MSLSHLGVVDNDRPQGPRVVALGGGHGLAASLSAIRHLTERVTAVVTVADDGGSSGRLREEMEIIPPGDLRQALSALCHDAAWGRTWRDVLQHRFRSTGPMAGHATGNLLIAALWQIHPDPVVGLELIAQLLGARGRVLPMALDPMGIEATALDDQGREVHLHGQHEVAVTSHKVQSLRLIPADARPTPQALTEVAEADLLILGPGSWYTSVMPHLLFEPLAEAVMASNAKRCLLLNLIADAKETSGLSLPGHLDALTEYRPGFRADVVLVDPYCCEDTAGLDQAAQRLGAKVMFRQVAASGHPDRHDPLRLAAALRDVMDGYLGDARD